jgi:hypothetical protein
MKISNEGQRGASLPELIAFDGAVDCHAGAGAVALSLCGTAASAREHAEVLFSGAAAGAEGLPARLCDARVVELGGATTVASGAAPAEGLRRFRIEAREGRFELLARGIQVHQDIGGAFFSALPAARVPRIVRWGWSVLLTLLRFGPLARLLTGRSV